MGEEKSENGEAPAYGLPVIDTKEPKMVFARLTDTYLSDHLKSFGCHQGRHADPRKERGRRAIDLCWEKDKKTGEYRIYILPTKYIKAEEAGDVVILRTVEYWETLYRHKKYDVRILKEWRRGVQHVVKMHFCIKDPTEYHVEKFRLSFRSMRKRMVTQTALAEENAQKKLKKHLTKEQWKSYVLNDAFFQEGKLGYFYWIRKGLPTIVCRKTDKKTTMICGSFCYHLIGYHTDTFAGTHCPTDDVMAVLFTIRAAEKEFLRKATYHSISDPRGGI